jgi:hypothetical protein
MSMDWETHRILTRGGQPRGVVFTFPSGRVVMRRPLGYYASLDSTFESMADLEELLRKKRWHVVVARHFS